MKSRRALYPTQLLLFGGAYLALAALGSALEAKGERGPIWLLWPAAGLALAVLLRFGAHLWPAILIASFVYSGVVKHPLLWPAAAGLAAGNTLQALAGVYLLRRAGFHNELDRLRDVLALAMVAVLVAVISAVVGNLGLVAQGWLPPERFLDRALPRWLQNVMGM